MLSPAQPIHTKAAVKPESQNDDSAKQEERACERVLGCVKKLVHYRQELPKKELKLDGRARVAQLHSMTPCIKHAQTDLT